MHNFKELQVWKLSKDFCIEIYKVTKNFPASEKYGITSQLTRAAVSVPSNIAEGSSRKSDKDFSRFIDIALGSSYELETQLIIALELELIAKDEFLKLDENLNEIQKKLYNFNKYIQQQIKK